jgi:RNA polymerase sigma-70 factor (ECF subfamily)
MFGRLARGAEGAMRREGAEPIGATLAELAPMIRRVVHRHLGPDGDLDDATQDALIDVALALDRFRGESSLTTYVHAIAMRTGVRHRRRGRALPVLRSVDDPEDLRDPESIASQRQSVRALYRALDALHDSRREAFVLCAIEQIAHVEAARIAGVSVETLRQRLKRARADLAVLLRADPWIASMVSGPSDEETR